jgi:hypothetical protein
MRDLVVEFRYRNRLFRQGHIRMREPRARFSVLPDYWNSRAHFDPYIILERIPPSPDSGRKCRPDEDRRAQKRAVKRRQSLDFVCALEWIGLLGSGRRTQKEMVAEMRHAGAGGVSVCAGIARVLKLWGQDRAAIWRAQYAAQLAAYNRNMRQRYTA